MKEKDRIDQVAEKNYPYEQGESFETNLRNGIIAQFRTCFKQGAEWEKDYLMNKACEWLEEHFINECGYLSAGEAMISFNTKPAIEAFRKAMEE